MTECTFDVEGMTECTFYADLMTEGMYDVDGMADSLIEREIWLSIIINKFIIIFVNHEF